MSVQSGRGYLGISEVLAQLRPDFADISVSKIRFLETEGLITPARSPSGYRRFCTADVDRLRYILTAQRDQYLPLRVIKERLARLDAEREGLAAAGASADRAGGDRAGAGADRAGGDRAGRADGAQPRPPAGQVAVPQGRTGHVGPAAGPSARPVAPAAGEPAAGEPAAGAGAGAGAAQLTRRDLLEAAGISEALLTELDTFGLLRRTGRHYGTDALEVARTAVALTAYGVEARHLRAVRAAAERETAMIESLVAPILRQRSRGAADLASATAGELAALVLRLHCALVDGALAEAGLAAAAPAGHGAAAADLPVRGVRGASA